MGIVPKTRYDGVAMIIHWLTAVLMIYMVFFGVDLMKAGEKVLRTVRKLDLSGLVISRLEDEYAFSLEYAARLYCATDRRRYATSFFGVVDLLAVLPSYLALFFPELHALLDVRILRLLRVFRVLKLTSYLAEFGHLGEALAALDRRRKRQPTACWADACVCIRRRVDIGRAAMRLCWLR